MGGVGFVLGTFVTGPGFLENAAVNIWLRRLLIAAELGVCALTYLFAVFAVKAIAREDVLRLPKGEKIAAVLTKCKLLK